MLVRYFTFPGSEISLRPFLAESIIYGLAEDALRPYCGHYGPHHVTAAHRARHRQTDRPTGLSVHPAARRTDETPVTFRAASREKIPCSRRGCLHLTARRNGGQNTTETAGTHPESPEEDLDAV